MKNEKKEPHPGAPKTELFRLLNIIATGTEEESKAAKKQFVQLCRYSRTMDNVRKISPKEAREIITDVRSATTTQNHYRYLTSLSHIWIIFFGLYDELEALIFENISHASGNVRHAAVRLGRYLQVIDRKTRLDKSAYMHSRIVPLCKRIKQLLARYAPPEWKERDQFDQVIIENLKPSVVKSLLLLWQDTVFMYTEDDALYDICPECKLDFPVIPYDLHGNEEKWDVLAEDDRTVDDLYYDAMELLHDYRDRLAYQDAETLLLRALYMDEHNVQTLVGLSVVYEKLRDRKKERDYVNRAYEETKRVFPKWPEQMPWGILENRKYLRAIHGKATLSADEGDSKTAKKLYRLLLTLNPGDNQGIRYLLAGLYAGISGPEIDKMFDKGNRKQDWSKLEQLVADQNSKHKFWNPPNYE